MMSMPDWASSIVFEQPIWRWIGMITVLLLAASLSLLIRRIAIACAKRCKPSELHKKRVRLVHLISLLILIPVVVDVLSINLRFSGLVLEFLTLFLWALYTLMLTWTVWLGSSVFAESIVSSQQLLAVSIDSQLIRLALRLIATILSVAILVVGAQQLGIPTYSIIAGLGVGGVAFALAAKDSLANLLGSLLIMFEKPFRVGHWIKVGDTEGIVESVGFRSTRIRTFHNSLVSIPNDQLVNSVVDNMALRERKVVQIVLTISYATPADRVECFITGIRKLIEDSPQTYKKRFRVRVWPPPFPHLQFVLSVE